jgi:hypothetical protein
MVDKWDKDDYINEILRLNGRITLLDDQITELIEEIELLRATEEDKIELLKNLNGSNFSWVGIWEEARVFGGSEEGGWYFNHNNLVNKPFQIPDDLKVTMEKWFVKQYGSTKNQDVVMSDEAYTREIEMYGDLLEPIRGEVTSAGKKKITFHKEYPQEAPYPIYE